MVNIDGKCQGRCLLVSHAVQVAFLFLEIIYFICWSVALCFFLRLGGSVGRNGRMGTRELSGHVADGRSMPLAGLVGGAQSSQRIFFPRRQPRSCRIARHHW